jgi:Fe-S-cluster containining protein
MIYPFGIKPKPKELLTAIGNTKSIQNTVPKTKCKHRGCCCKAGCPNMYLTEYMALRENYLDKLSREDKLELLINCIRYYLTKQYEDDAGRKKVANKPCLLLDENNSCKAYLARPLKCRLYGIIPIEMYRRVVEEVSNESGIKKTEIPLCVQCPYVEADKGSIEITENFIADLEERIKKNNNSIGISKVMHQLGYAFLTLHDWHIMCELGEEWMIKLSPIREQQSKEWKESFLKDLRRALDTGT